MTNLDRFLADTRGSVTMEFVIVFPVIIMLIMFILFASTLFATVSDVQHLAYELARAGVGTLSRMKEGEDLCAQMATDILPSLVGKSVMLGSAGSITLPPCPGQPDANGYITINVTFDLLNGAISSLGDQFGFKLGEITRTAVVRAY